MHARMDNCKIYSIMIHVGTELENWSNDEFESAIAAKDLGYSQQTSSQCIVLHVYLFGKIVFVSRLANW